MNSKCLVSFTIFVIVSHLSLVHVSAVPPLIAITLPGSSMTEASAASKADLIFSGKVLSTGHQVILPTDEPYSGPLYRGVLVKVLKSFHASTAGKVSVSIFINYVSGENVLVEGKSYIFFVETKRESAAEYPYNCLTRSDANAIAIKLLPDTNFFIEETKSLIAHTPQR